MCLSKANVRWSYILICCCLQLNFDYNFFVKNRVLSLKLHILFGLVISFKIINPQLIHHLPFQKIYIYSISIWKQHKKKITIMAIAVICRKNYIEIFKTWSKYSPSILASRGGGWGGVEVYTIAHIICTYKNARFWHLKIIN